MDKLFDFSFSPVIRETSNLYYYSGGFALQNGVLCSERGRAFVCFRTYFHSVSIEKLIRYSDITELVYKIELTGRGEAALYADETLITKQTIRQSGEISAELYGLPAGSKILYPVFTAETAGCELRRITVFAKSRTVRTINCALLICTYCREEAVKSTVSYLSRKSYEANDFPLTVIIADNGRTLEQSEITYKSSGGKCILLSNPNTGGSGGYKAAMQKAAAIGGFTHVICMDDDVKIDYLALQKGLNFLKFVKKEYEEVSLGGAMIYRDKPTIQFEAGGYFGEDGRQIGYGHFLELADRENIAANEAEHKINYGGWWLMCMPFRYVAEQNYPLPFFMKYDDVEYSLRCRLKIITLNGFAVWHPRFEDNYNSACEYYNIRNYLFLCKKYCAFFSEKRARKIVFKRLMEKLLRQQYNMAEAVIQAYRDYCKGMEFLYHMDAEANHRKITQLNDKMISYDEIERQCSVRPKESVFYPPPGRRDFLRMIRPKKYIVTDVFNDCAAQYFSAKGAVHCDAAKNRGYITKRDYKRFWKLIRKFNRQRRRRL